MSVIVARAPVSVARISPRGWGAIRLIEGGVAWLDWAIRDQDALYHFDDETAMVAAIQSGLHATELVLLPRTGLLIGPARLMQLAPADLKALAAAEAGDTSTAVQTRVGTVLSANRFLTAKDLQVGTTFLNERQQQSASVFQVVTFNERVALANLAGAQVPGDLSLDAQIEAANFATSESRNPLEFVDYYSTYLALFDASGKANEAADDRRNRIQAAVDELQPLLFDALDCPRIAGSWDVRAAIAEWFLLGNRIGFARISAGVQQIVASTKFGRTDYKGTAETAVAAYLDAAQALLLRQNVEAGVLGQDGVTTTFTVANDAEQAVVTLGADSILTLTSYCWLAPPPADAAQPPQPSATVKRKEKK